MWNRRLIDLFLSAKHGNKRDHQWKPKLRGPSFVNGAAAWPRNEEFRVRKGGCCQWIEVRMQFIGVHVASYRVAAPATCGVRPGIACGAGGPLILRATADNSPAIQQFISSPSQVASSTRLSRTLCTLHDHCCFTTVRLARPVDDADEPLTLCCRPTRMDARFPISRDDLYNLQMEVKQVQYTQTSHAERLMRLEKRNADDSALKSVWNSPFPGVLGGTPHQGNDFTPCTRMLMPAFCFVSTKPFRPLALVPSSNSNSPRALRRDGRTNMHEY